MPASVEARLAKVAAAFSQARAETGAEAVEVGEGVARPSSGSSPSLGTRPSPSPSSLGMLLSSPSASSWGTGVAGPPGSPSLGRSMRATRAGTSRSSVRPRRATPSLDALKHCEGEGGREGGMITVGAL